MNLAARFGVTSALLGSLISTLSLAQTSVSSNVLSVDASRPVQMPAPADYHGGASTSPRGETIGMNERFLTVDGKPWLPVMGEFHYTRVPESEWEDEILKMKAAGVQIVATYVIWIHHEEVQSQFDWSGQRDLRHFVELCAKHGMYVYPRIGPWAHGETRNGGFPDWLLKQSNQTRSNDPVYLSYVKTWYGQIGEQLKGLLWKDGGPIIGIQLENEYSRRGPDQGEAHILSLKQMAIEAGFDVPIYSVTGWDNAVVPKEQVVAVFGGYPDAPWDASMDQLPPEEVYAFRFGSRVSGNMGAIGAAATGRKESTYGFPFITAEMGGGVQDTYHRRPVISPDDIAAMMPVMLGSGVNLYGTYMFQGGENPAGKLTTLQESQATGYPTDVPVKSYDFQAPLSQFGEERQVLRKLKIFNYFLNDFGGELAPMVPFAPAKVPASPTDLSVPRLSVRSDGKSGFLFFNNYVRDHPMPPRLGFQVRIKLPDRELAMPAQPINLPSGVYGIWPFGLKLGSLRLQYATAQLFARTESSSEETYYFEATPGVAPEFVFENATDTTIQSQSKQETHDGAFYIRGVQPSLQPAIISIAQDGHKTRIVLLSPEQSENAWKLGEGTALLITKSQYFAAGAKVTLLSDGDPQFRFTVIPPVAAPSSEGIRISTVRRTAFAGEFSATVPKVSTRLQVESIQQAGTAPRTRIGPPPSWRPQGVAMAPTDAEFSQAAKWKLSIHPSDWSGIANLFLQIDYDGDIARLVSGENLLDDNFYNGQPWCIGLERFRSQISRDGLELEILPRRADSPIFLEKRFRTLGFTTGQRAQLGNAQLIPQYALKLNFDLER